MMTAKIPLKETPMDDAMDWIIPTTADDDWITAVTPVPRRIPFTGFPASLYRTISILLPATFLSESPMTDIPKRNIATPPNKEIMLVASI